MSTYAEVAKQKFARGDLFEAATVDKVQQDPEYKGLQIR